MIKEWIRYNDVSCLLNKKIPVHDHYQGHQGTCSTVMIIKIIITIIIIIMSINCLKLDIQYQYSVVVQLQKSMFSES